MPKAVPNAKEPLALSAVGSSTPTLARFNPDSDRQRWLSRRRDGMSAMNRSYRASHASCC